MAHHTNAAGETLGVIPGIGPIPADAGMLALEACTDGVHRPGENGVEAILATGDRKVEFICHAEHALAWVNSAMGYPAYYPVRPVALERPVKAVLMDLDGTSVRSEAFWVWIIQQSTASLLDNPRFELEEADLPHVSGHSVSEHLEYCVRKYCPDKSVEEARAWYFEHTRREMGAIMEGGGRKDAFVPTPGLTGFLCGLKDLGVKIGLVTSGLYEKAWPEILSAFRSLGMDDPADFYDAIITAGYPLGQGPPGTLGELSPKPHPWLYAETARVGLEIPFADRGHVLGIEDSGAGVCSIRLAGFTTVGLGGGNIEGSGTRALCGHFCETLPEVMAVIKG